MNKKTNLRCFTTQDETLGVSNTEKNKKTVFLMCLKEFAETKARHTSTKQHKTHG